MRKKNKRKKSENNEIASQLQQIETERQRKIEDSKESFNETSILEDYETQLTSNEPIRELFSPKNVKFKTELTEEQRASIAILYDAYKTLVLEYNIAISALKTVLDEYVDFGVSVGREGRKEFVEAQKATAQAEANRGMMQSSINQNSMKM